MKHKSRNEQKEKQEIKPEEESKKIQTPKATFSTQKYYSV